jgi:hypothetical protein
VQKKSCCSRLWVLLPRFHSCYAHRQTPPILKTHIFRLIYRSYRTYIFLGMQIALYLD